MSLRSLLLLALLCAAGMHTVHARRALMQGDEGGADEDLLAPAPAAAAALPAAAWDWAPAPTPAAVPIQTFNLEPTDDDVGPATEDGEQAADNQEAEKPKPKPKKRNTSIERYDPETSYTADTPLNLREGSRATVGDVPTAQGFKQHKVGNDDKGTCNLQNRYTQVCYDGMGDDSREESYRALLDADNAPECGITDLDKVVASIEDWAYWGRWGRCGVRAYTVSKMCKGDGDSWRVKLMLWPDSDKCKPICIKIRGSGDSADEYGRTASC